VLPEHGDWCRLRTTVDTDDFGGHTMGVLHGLITRSSTSTIVTSYVFGGNRW
jgi:hypothetical protein